MSDNPTMSWKEALDRVRELEAKLARYDDGQIEHIRWMRDYPILAERVNELTARAEKAEAELARRLNDAMNWKARAEKAESNRDWWREQAKNVNDEWKRAHVPGWAEKEVTILLEAKKHLGARVAELEHPCPDCGADISAWLAVHRAGYHIAGAVVAREREADP